MLSLVNPYWFAHHQNYTVPNLKPGLHLSYLPLYLRVLAVHLTLNRSSEIFLNIWMNDLTFAPFLYYFISLPPPLLPILPPSNIHQAFSLHWLKKKRKTLHWLTWAKGANQNALVWHLMPFMTGTLPAFSASTSFTNFQCSFLQQEVAPNSLDTQCYPYFHKFV